MDSGMSRDVIELTAANFDAELARGQGALLVDFWAPWCGPCRTMGPVLKQIAGDYSDVLRVAKVNVDDNQELAVGYGVMSIPTLLLFRSGAVEKKLVGALPMKRLIEELGLPPHR